MAQTINRSARALSTVTYAVISIVGIIAFLSPFWRSQRALEADGLGHSQDSPLLTLLLICMCLVAMVLDAQSNTLNAKTVALLGVLVSVNSVLRFIEVAMPGPGGFTPIFFLIILAGFVFGARFGFLMGSLSLLTSALVTGGVGPWLPFQMFTAGWMGLSAGLVGVLTRRVEQQRVVLVLLAIFGGLWGFLYGAIMNVWFWPFATNPAQQNWQHGLAPGDVVWHYMTFYAITSLVWDAFAGAGNVVLIALFAPATLRVLRRARSRFNFTTAR